MNNKFIKYSFFFVVILIYGFYFFATNKIETTVIYSNKYLANENINNIINININKDNFSIGDKVTATVFLDNLLQNIDIYFGTLVYDKDVLSLDKITVLDGWDNSSFTFNSTNNMFVVERNELSNIKQNVLDISFNVIGNKGVNSTSIDIINNYISGGNISDGINGDIKINDAKVNILLSSNTNNSTNSNIINNVTNSNPSTGNSSVFIIFLFIISLLIILSVLNRKIIMEFIFKNKFIKSKKFLFSILIFTIILIIYNISSSFSYRISELVEMRNHVIKMNILPNDRISMYDRNNDGKITICDISIMKKDSSSNNENSINVVSDNIIIPDEFNTGVNESISLTNIADITDPNSGNRTFKLNGLTFMYYHDTAIELRFREFPIEAGNYYFENYDFTRYTIRTHQLESAPSIITIKFVNCVFKNMDIAGINSSNIHFYFENCTFTGTVSVSNADFIKCKFLMYINDGTDALANVRYNDCFFLYVPSNIIADLNYHIDGIQIYGSNVNKYKMVDQKAEDIHMNNVRMVILPLNYREHLQGVNADIMLQLEFNSGDNITFDNMHIIGGGFSIYATIKNVLDYRENYTLTNTSFNNIYVGMFHHFGILNGGDWFTDKDGNQISHNNVGYVTNAYISSIWKDSNDIHVIATNELNEKRNLKIEFENGYIYNYELPACPTYKEYFALKGDPDTVYPAEKFHDIKLGDFPFDIDITIPISSIGDSRYLKIYDGDTLIRTKVLSENEHVYANNTKMADYTK